MSVPPWHSAARPDRPLPLADMLDGCTYYPASGLDGVVFSRVWRSAAPGHSFFYVDHGISRDSLSADVERRIDRGGRGLLGYQPAFRRPVSRGELAVPGYDPRIRLSDPEQARASEMYRLIAGISGPADVPRKAYCEWIVFDRLQGFGAEHGPERLSLLFLFADGVSAYDYVFLARRKVPRTLVVKQPGHAFGGAYANLFKQRAPLCRAVEAGVGWPEYLIFGSRGGPEDYRDLIWHDDLLSVVYDIYKEEGIGDGKSLVFARLRRDG